MKTIKFLLTGILVCFTMFAQSQNISPDIVTGLKTGNVGLIGKYFAKSVELKILDLEKTCSDVDANAALSKFFQSNAPKDFSIIHSGERTGSSYIIGKLTTATGEFRVTYFGKKSDNQCLINQFKIEKF